LVIAQTLRTGAVICSPVVDALVAQIIARKIDVLIIDPFVSCHEVAENDNGAMDMVVKEWGRVADRGNCAVELVQHTRKGELEVTTESSRGGKALTDGCRTVRVVNRMTKEEAEKAGVENHRLYFRTFNDKANLTPPADSSDWFKLESVDLANGPLLNGMGGDNVGVVVAWQWPDHLASVTGADFERAAIVIRGGKWRKDVQSPLWVGNAVARALGLDVQNRTDRAKISSMLKMWMAARSLIEVDGEDDARRPRKFIEVADQP
jgi:AAA domain